MPPTEPKSALVIGGGITGLTTAYRLQTLAAEAGVALKVTVLEAADRVGGVIETIVADGFVMERGPDSIITEKPWAAELCSELAMAADLVPTRREPSGSFIVSRGRLCRVPDGLHLMAPSRLGPFAASSLISWPGKLRALGDLLIPRRTGEGDESLGSFVRRRLGTEALERLAQPMVGGIYTADPDKLSLAATMPRFIDMEKKYGSVIRGLMTARRKAGTSARGPRYDLFVAPRKGTEAITRRLVETLPPDSIETGVRAENIRIARGRWEVETSVGSRFGDGLCICSPAHATATLLAQYAPGLAAELDAIEYASATTVNLVYPREAVPNALAGFGFVVPAIEKRDILACTYSSVKYEGRAPADKVLLRAFLGGAMSPEKFDLDDRDTLASVKRELGDLLGITREPEQTLISRHPRAMPQYHVGHLARVGRIEAAIAAHPGLELAGNAYRGTGMPDCIRSANQAAERLFGQLFGTKES